MSPSDEFLARFGELYLDSFLANIAVGALLGALGLFVVLRRVVFVSAALSQVASAGLALAFFLGALAAHQVPVKGPPPDPGLRARPGERLDDHKPKDDVDKEILEGLGDDDDDAKTKPAAMTPKPAMAGQPPPPPKVRTGDPPPGFTHRHEAVNPFLFSLLLTVLIALVLGLLVSQTSWRSTAESIVGLVFILAAAASIVLAQLAEKGAHEIANLLFGMVVFVPKAQQIWIYVAGGVVLAIYGWFFKDFLFASFDPTAARASGFPVRAMSGLLFVLIAVSIAVSTRAVGAMPVFALTVLPATAALQLHERMVPAAITATIIGAASAAGGYFCSGLFNLSAGPLIVVAGTVFVGLAWGGRLLVGAIRTRAA